MGPNWLKYAALAAMAATSLSSAAASADESASWVKGRQARFAAYHGAHPKPAADVAAIKAETAALVAGAGPAGDLQARVDQPPLIWRGSRRPSELWDGVDYPEMIVVPAGEYTMGSAANEANRGADEGPRHRVRIAYSFAVGKYPVTLGEFERFVADTGFDAGDSCFNFEPGDQPRPGRNFRQTGSIDQTLDEPAVCMNEVNAQAYAAWLSKKTGHAYRLLSEAEYEYAARAGTTTRYWWGDDPSVACANADGADMDTGAKFPKMSVNACHDGYAATAPVGSFKPNAFGLYDMAGNAWSILADCYAPYDAAPTDGSPNLTGPCTRRSLRGGPWLLNSAMLRSALRGSYAVGGHFIGHGFRVARTL